MFLSLKKMLELRQRDVFGAEECPEITYTLGELKLLAGEDDLPEIETLEELGLEIGFQEVFCETQ